MLFSLCGCFGGQTPPPDEVLASPPEDVELEEQPADDDISSELFSAFLPDEFMSKIKGHEMSVNDNPLIGTYETTSGCIMILMTGGYYIWQDPMEVPAVTGIYEIFEGAIDGNTDEFSLESETGPLYTVIITFRDEYAAMYGTIQVFDFYKKGVYRVTDLINDFWFEATRILEEEE